MKKPFSKRSWLMLLFLSVIFSQSGLAQPCKDVVGYYNGADEYSSTTRFNTLTKPSLLKYSKYTTINYAFLKVNSDGSIQSLLHADSVCLLTPNTNLVDMAHLNGVKVMLSFGGDDATQTSNFSTLAGTQAKIDTFKNQCVRMLRTTKADGIDIDWEFPGKTLAADSANFKNLISSLRTALTNYNSSTVLSVAAPVNTTWITYYNILGIKNKVDYFNVMSYDYNDPDWSDTSDHNSPILNLPGRLCWKKSYTTYTGPTGSGGYAVPKSKINMGAPFYTHAWAPCSTYHEKKPTSWSIANVTPKYYIVRDSGGSYSSPRSYTAPSDANGRVASLRCKTGGYWHSFDDSCSIAKKALFIDSVDCRGIMFWSLGSEYRSSTTRLPLTDTILSIFCNSTNMTQRNSLYFTNTTRVGIPYNSKYDITTGDFTIETWVKIPSTAMSDRPFLSNRPNPFGNHGFLFNTSLTGTHINIQMTIDGVSYANYGSNTIACVFDDKWHHYAVTRNSSRLVFYLDGVSVGSFAGITRGLKSPNDSLYIGRDQVDNNSLNGYIDQVRIWSVAKTEAEIVANLNATMPKTTSNLLGNYLLNEASGQNVIDSVNSNPANGYLGNSSSTESTDPARSVYISKIGTSSGLEFDQTDDRVNVPHITAYDLGTGNFTIEAWIRMDACLDRPIFSSRTSSSFSGIMLKTWYDVIDCDGKKLLLQINGHNVLSTSLSSSLYDNKCHHIVVVRSGTTITFYVDGTSYSASGALGYDMTQSVAAPFYIGWDEYDGANFPVATAFPGMIDEIRFWNVARAGSDITACSTKVFMKDTTSGIGLIGYWRFKEISGQRVIDGSSNDNSGTLGTNSSAVDSKDPVRSASNCYTGVGSRMASIVNVDNSSDMKNYAIYPNPFNSSTNVIVYGNEGENSLLIITDVRGSEIFSDYVMNNQVSTIGDQLSVGIYIVKIVSSNSTKTYKMLKSN